MIGPKGILAIGWPENNHIFSLRLEKTKDYGQLLEIAAIKGDIKIVPKSWQGLVTVTPKLLKTKKKKKIEL